MSVFNLGLNDAITVSDEFSYKTQWFESTFIEPADLRESIRQSIYDRLPDDNVYDKNVMHADEANRKTLLYTVENTYATEIDRLRYFISIFGYDLDHISDDRLYDTYGYLFNFRRPTWMPFPEYRFVLKQLKLAYNSGSVIAGIKRIVYAFFGTEPDLLLIRDNDLHAISGLNYFDLDEFNSYIDTEATADEWTGVIWAEAEAQNGLTCRIHNTGNFQYDIATVERLIRYVIPAWVNIYFSYVTN